MTTTTIDPAFRYGPSRHDAHNSGGRFRPLSLPPVDDTTPKTVAKTIDAYRALAVEHRSVTGQLADLSPGPRHGTPRAEAAARRTALEDAQADLQSQLDDTLDDLVAAIRASSWADDIAHAQANARQVMADAADTIEAAAADLAGHARVAGWLATFPGGKGWPDERLAGTRYTQPRIAGQPVAALVAPLRALADPGPDAA